jgi:hypothetical protein
MISIDGQTGLMFTAVVATGMRGVALAMYTFYLFGRESTSGAPPP